MKKLITLLIFLLYTSAWATDFDVGTTCDGSCDYASINSCIDAISSGDRCLIYADAIFQEAVTISSGGSVGNYKTIQNYPGESPILDGNSGALNRGIDLATGVTYVKIIGLEIRNFADYGITTWADRTNSYITIQDCTIHDNGDGDQYDGNVTFHGNPDNLTIDNNVIYNGMGTYSGIFLYGNTPGTGNIISNNVLYHNPKNPTSFLSNYGLFLQNIDDSTINNNYVYFSQKSNRITESCTGNSIYNNVFAYSGYCGLDLHTNVSSNILKNNIFAYNGNLGSNPKSTGTTNAFYNNVFYANGHVQLFQLAGASNVEFQNNIFDVGKYGIYIDEGGVGTHLYNNYNDLITDVVGFTKDATATAVVPGFADVENFNFVASHATLQNTGNNPSGDCDEVGLCSNFIDSTKILPYRPLTVDSSSGGGTPALSIDHRTNSNTYAWSTGTETPWIIYDMGSSKTVKHFGIQGGTANTSWPSGFNIQISSNKVDWSTIVTDTIVDPGSLEPAIQWFDADTYFTGRYIKLNVTSSRGEDVVLTEFYAVGPFSTEEIIPSTATIMGASGTFSIQ